MCVIEAGVDVADQHRSTAACDLVRLRRLDLAHVPLESRQVIAVAGRLVAVAVTIAALVLDRGLELEGQRVRIGRSFDIDAFLGPAGELGIARSDDDDSDRVVARDDRAPLQLKLAQQASRDGLLFGDHDVRLRGRRRVGAERRRDRRDSGDERRGPGDRAEPCADTRAQANERSRHWVPSLGLVVIETNVTNASRGQAFESRTG